MVNVAILVPHEEMCAVAAPMMEEFPAMSVMCLECVDSSENSLAVSRAQELVDQGCEVIIARGVQSRMIKYNTSVPVVEIQLTTQELGMAMLELRRELGCKNPGIGLICFDNMIGDTSHFSELFGIDFKLYFVKNSEELSSSVDRAVEDGCLAVIGGSRVCDRAKELGILSRFLPAGAESLRNALTTASRICYAIDQEKHNLTEMDTMLNNTFSGIMQVDSSGVIQRVNRTGYTLLNMSPNDLLGKKVVDVIPSLTKVQMDNALIHGQELYAFVINIQHKAIVSNIAPIQVSGSIKGAILTFQESWHIIEMDSELRRELFQRGFVSKYGFDTIVSLSKVTQELVKTGMRIAKFHAPILLTGDAGSGKGIFAQCIHKESLNKNNAYVNVDCSAWMPETLDGMLFGNYSSKKDSPACLVELAENGTLYLSSVEHLLPETQYKLLKLTQGKLLRNGVNTPVSANVRVIASSECSLITRVEQGEFRRDLYYALNVLGLELPPLRQRREDIPGWMDHFLSQYQEKHKRYLQLTNGARDFIVKYDWPGNLDQIRSICERIVLLTEKRNVDEVFLRKQLEMVTPVITKDAEKVVFIQDPKALEISQMLKRYRGNREKVSAELGISKTTLWRYMKKYGIEANTGK